MNGLNGVLPIAYLLFAGTSVALLFRGGTKYYEGAKDE
jgi:hypothetical protein